MKKGQIFLIILLLLIIVVLLFLLLSNNKSDVEGETNNEKIVISFNSGFALEVNSIEINKDSNAVLPNITREGYNFLGWYYNDLLIDNNYKFSNNITLNAKWELNSNTVDNTITISFDSDGGTMVNSITINCNDPLPKLEIPTKDKSEFISWMDSTGNTVSEGSKLTCNDQTLKAKWKNNTFKICFFTGYGENVRPITLACGSPIPKLDRPGTTGGKTFIYWRLRSGEIIKEGDVLKNCENVMALAIFCDVGDKGQLINCGPRFNGYADKEYENKFCGW